MEVACKRCSFWNPAAIPASAMRPCPNCGSALFRKKDDAPDVKGHAKALAATVFSVGGVLVLLIYSVLMALPLWRVRIVAALVLYVTSVKLAWSAMNAQGGRIKFPELDPREFFGTSLIPLVVYAVVFVSLPTLGLAVAWDKDPLGWHADAQGRLLDAHQTERGAAATAEEEGHEAELDEAAFDDDGEPTAETLAKWEEQREQAEARNAQAVAAANRKAWRQTRGKIRTLRVGVTLASLFLGFYAAMALLLFLRSNTARGMFDLPAAFTILRTDPRGYLALAAVVMLINAFRSAVSIVGGGTLLAMLPVHIINGVGTMAVYGLAGLYVRQNARLFGVPCDDDDWEPVASFHTATPAAHSPSGAPLAALGGLPPMAPAQLQVLLSRFTGRTDGTAVVQDVQGRTTTLAAASVKKAAAALVKDDSSGAPRWVLVVDALVSVQPTALTVLRFTSDHGNAAALFSGDMPPAQVWAALLSEWVKGGAEAWPDAIALAHVRYPQFASMQAFEQACYPAATPSGQ